MKMCIASVAAYIYPVTVIYLRKSKNINDNYRICTNAKPLQSAYFGLLLTAEFYNIWCLGFLFRPYYNPIIVYRIQICNAHSTGFKSLCNKFQRIPNSALNLADHWNNLYNYQLEPSTSGLQTIKQKWHEAVKGFYTRGSGSFLFYVFCCFSISTSFFGKHVFVLFLKYFHFFLISLPLGQESSCNSQ